MAEPADYSAGATESDNMINKLTGISDAGTGFALLIRQL
jgi:hypothetical protein